MYKIEVTAAKRKKIIIQFTVRTEDSCFLQPFSPVGFAVAAPKVLEKSWKILPG